MVQTSLDAAESLAEHSHQLIDRYLVEWRSSTIPASLDSFYSNVSIDMILHGLFMHHICYGSHKRHRFEELDLEAFYDGWVASAASALSTFDDYSKDNQGIPDAIFQHLYAKDAEQTVALRVLAPGSERESRAPYGTALHRELSWVCVWTRQQRISVTLIPMRIVTGPHR